MHLSYGGEYRERLWRYAYENNLIGLDYEGVDEEWVKIPESKREKLIQTRDWHRQFQLFCENMKVGDCVLVTAGMSPSYLLGVGLVASPYFFDKKLDEFFRHLREVRWLVKYKWEDRRPFKAYFRKTLLRIDSNSRLWNLTDREIDVKNNVKTSTCIFYEQMIIWQSPSKQEIEQAKDKLRSEIPEREIDIKREIKILNSRGPARLPRVLERRGNIKVGSDSVDISAAVNLIKSNVKIDIKPVYIKRYMNISTVKRCKQDVGKFRKLISRIERKFGIKTGKFTCLCIDDTTSRDAFVFNNTILCNLLRFRERKSYSFWLVTLAREFAYILHPKRDMKHMNLMRELLVKAIEKQVVSAPASILQTM